jgi:hypothetical protein
VGEERSSEEFWGMHPNIIRHTLAKRQLSGLTEGSEFNLSPSDYGLPRMCLKIWYNWYVTGVFLKII